MIKRFAFSALLIFTLSSQAQNPREVDSIAVRLVDKMSAVIGELSAVSVSLETANDEQNDLFENERLFAQHQLRFSGPSNMTVHSRGDGGNKAFWYNGEFLTYYSFDENNYVTLETPDNTMDMIDSLHTKFGIKFPGADIFFPTLTDDILNNFDHFKYLGLKEVDGEQCFHVMASSEEMTFQLWITNDAMYLPKKYLFLDKKDHHKQFEGTFSNWVLNPIIPATVFEFTPPKNARLISIMAKS